MKLIHTADWHLGQTFYGYDRSYEHRQMLAWLLHQIAETEADLLLISGDVFDTPNPSAAAQKLLFDFLHDTTQKCPNLKIIITAGNHDSGARLESPSPILESFNITVRGTVPRTEDNGIDFNHLIIPVSNDACCLAVPYLRIGDYPSTPNHNEGIKEMYATLVQMAREQYGTIVAMGHLHASDSILSTGDNSERIIIGGLDNVDISSVTQHISYTALGHLHKAQSIGGHDNIRYSGAPLPMSFAERDNRQSITLVTIENDKTQTKKIIYDTPVKLLSIPDEPQPLHEALSAIEALPKGEITAESPYLEIRILVDGPEPTLRMQIEKALEGRSVRLTRIEAVSPKAENSTLAPLTYDELRNMSPIKLATDYYCRHYGQEQLPPVLKEMLMNTIKEVETENTNNETHK